MPGNTPSTSRVDDLSREEKRAEKAHVPSVDELIQQQTEALQALIARKREEEVAKAAEEEANMTPEQRIMRAVNARLEHMDSQIVKLGGHSYRLYDL